MGSSLTIRLFGPMDVQVNEKPLPRLKTRKGLWLLALLVLRPGKEVARDWLAGTLWPDAEEANALLYLRQTLTDLRRAFGAEAERIVSPTSRTLCLELAGADIDVLMFDRCVAQRDMASLEQAVTVYRGPLLEDCAEDWALMEREAREQAYLGALEQLAKQATAAGDSASAVRRLRLLVTADPLRESAYRALMEALAAGRDYAAVTEIYRELRLLLRRELNVEPDAETQELFQSIRTQARQQAHGSQRQTTLQVQPEFRSPSSHVSLPVLHHVPRSLSVFIGRDYELEAAKRWLLANRLVTLTGIGGVGKTRLAIQLAEAVVADFPEGVWFVDFSSLTDPVLLPRTVAAAMNLSEAVKTSALQSLNTHLREQHLLLVLDNCEHLLDASAELALALLQTCPRLHILATSRQRLGIEGEAERRIPPLGLPNLDHPPAQAKNSSEELLEYEAVRLFVERARLVQSNLQLDNRTVTTITEICVRLDGIPLAIELAAARMRAVGLEQIAARLNDRFRLLVGGSRVAQPRQQTLRALLDWSYDLLTEEERILLRRLSVFAGGWTLEAAEATCNNDSEVRGDELHSAMPDYHSSVHHSEVLDLLTSLVDKSLVITETNENGFRYRMLETVRQYSHEKLRQSGEETTLRARHRDYFLALAEEAMPQLSGIEQAYWFDHLEQEHDNLRAGLDWCLLEPNELVPGIRMAAALQRFWKTRGHVGEGRRHYAALLEKDTEAKPSVERAGALFGEGSMADHQGDYATARMRYEEALAVQRDIGDRHGEAQTLMHLAYVLKFQGNNETARELYEQSLSLYRTLDHKAGQASCLTGLGSVLLSEDKPQQARTCFEQALTLSRALGDLKMQANHLNALGMVAERLQDDAVARDYFLQSLAVHREIGDYNHIMVNLNNLGNTARKLGKPAEALEYYREALQLAHRLGESRGQRITCFVLEGISAPLLALGESERATRLLSAGLALRERIGARLAPHDQEEYDLLKAELIQALGETAFTEAWNQGQAMSLEAALREVLT